MALILTSAPALEPITVAEAKAHCRIDGSAEDALVASLILTSRLHIEQALGLALIAQSWTYAIDAWPKARSLALPLRPILSVTAVRVLASDGTPSIVAPAGYLLDGQGVPARIVRTTTGWPAAGRTAQGIEIDFIAGFGADAEDVPAPVRQALLLLVAHWYEHRDPIDIGSAATRVPDVVSELLRPYRVTRL